MVVHKYGCLDPKDEHEMFMLNGLSNCFGAYLGRSKWTKLTLS
jgi:hypothetical protein